MNYVKNLLNEAGSIRKPLRPIEWHPSALGELRDFPKDLQQRIGGELQKVQSGHSSPSVLPVWPGKDLLQIGIGPSQKYCLVIKKMSNYLYGVHAFIRSTHELDKRALNTIAERCRGLPEALSVQTESAVQRLRQQGRGSVHAYR